MTKKPVKIGGKVYFQDTGGKMEETSYEHVILVFLDKNTPPAMTSQEIADKIGLAYPTIHPKLKALNEQGLITGRKDQTPRPGKQRLLWEKAGDIDTILARWESLAQGN